MKKELRIFFTALMFLTRLPVPKTTDHNLDYLQKAAKYFPMIGWVVGIICGLTFAAGNFLSTPIAAVLCIIAGLVTTGAFHEDGFADSCDGFGGGWTKEKILAIMKDSRLGTFGVAGLIMILLLKYFLLVHITLQIANSNWGLSSFEKFSYPALVIIAAHTASRWMPLLLIQNYSYVFQEDVSKSKPLASAKLRFVEILFAFLAMLVPMIFLPLPYLTGIPPMILVSFWLAQFFKKWIGGYTGDCLGAVQQVTEITFLLSIVIINKYWLTCLL
ncbi:adenosylcobinamide-GDP ribazoletransferase [Terrimonas alba]|uniref:adenosylcobinamide-GDP ribazoletransferase n=1 Tax=Terrimonas alba TaxID=3349636 RepID=UPI0035F3B519